MKKLGFLMIGLMLSTVLVMTAVGCDNDSEPSAHAIVEGTWETASEQVSSGKYEKKKIVISASSVIFFTLTSTDEKTWVDGVGQTSSITASKVVGTAVSLTVSAGTEVMQVTGTLSNSNNTFTLGSGGDPLTYTRQ